LAAGSVIAAVLVSSSRRHTRVSRDCSSDVCSSDLDKAKIRHWVITGKVTGKRRDDIVQAFKNCEEPCVLVGGISAMGEGLDIDRSEERRVGEACAAGRPA